MIIDDRSTVLWALQSPCNMGCRYCYYGTIEDEHDRKHPLKIGELSHTGYNDLSKTDILDFANSISCDQVKRIFVAGGEPLNWKGSFDVIKILKNKNCEVIVCTNGLPLTSEKTRQWLLDEKVDAISISIDSINEEYNDLWRVDKTNRGLVGILNALKELQNLKRLKGSKTKIGIYMVVSRQNISHIVDSCAFFNNIGLDYFIIQPISLSHDHKLFDILSLNESHEAQLRDIFETLFTLNIKIKIPQKTYLNLFLHTLPNNAFSHVDDCFGGSELFFIQPDGSVWDCPSSYKKMATTQEEYRSIKGGDAKKIFSKKRICGSTDCNLLTKDCVNMWQLMAFDDILYG